ncbi:hypothetical protein OAP18_02785 [Gammaproteobacteria bacterium]|nr:hypothetical protein [Gammaproteobacteria bacterium]
MFQRERPWPENIPSKEYFIAAYQAAEADHEFQTQEDYLYWVLRFYNGLNSVVPGWLGITAQVLDRLEEPQRSVVEARLYALGSRIGTEWPKDNRVRLLNSRSANVWRDALIEALNRDELDSYLDVLEQDVDDLLAGTLDNDEIYFERYYVDEFDDF